MPERIITKMKQLISDWILANEPEQSGQNTKPCLAFAGLPAYTKFLSDESKVLLLAHLYLELCLNAEQALRAARADVMTATRSTRAQTHRLLEEQPR